MTLRYALFVRLLQSGGAIFVRNGTSFRLATFRCATLVFYFDSQASSLFGPFIQLYLLVLVIIRPVTLEAQSVLPVMRIRQLLISVGLHRTKLFHLTVVRYILKATSRSPIVPLQVILPQAGYALVEWNSIVSGLKVFCISTLNCCSLYHQNGGAVYATSNMNISSSDFRYVRYIKYVRNRICLAGFPVKCICNICIFSSFSTLGIS